MDTISWVMLGITALFLVFGALFGFKRGVARSILRLITLGVAFVLAWFLKDTYVAAIMNLEVDGVGARTLLAEISAQMPALSSVIERIAALMLGVILFVIVFLLLKLVTLLFFCILKGFVPKSNRIVGLIVGLVQGALIALCVCAPLNGLLVDIGKFADMDMGEDVDVSAVREIGTVAKEYADGGISKLYTAVGGGFYKALTVTVNEKGEEVSFSAYVDAAVSSGKLVSAFGSAANMDMSEGLTEENRDTIHQIFKDLDAAKSEIGEETITIVNELISAVAADLGTTLPESVTNVLENFDMSEISFEQEGETVMTLYDFLEGEGEVTAADAVNALAESDVILSVVEGILAEEQTHLEIADEATKAEVSAAISDIADPAVREQLNNLFGIFA